MSDDEFKAFQIELLKNPQMGNVMPGCGGFRKVRMALPGRGKRGSARVIYLFVLVTDIIYLVDVYTKGDQADIPASDRKKLARYAAILKGERKDEEER
ncbi:MAG: type II toxin-antitoxin system RelE/ParE family toxin [bacterium]